MRISDWSSDVCSSDLLRRHRGDDLETRPHLGAQHRQIAGVAGMEAAPGFHVGTRRSEEHTSELQSLMRISYAVFCLKKKTKKKQKCKKRHKYRSRHTTVQQI